MCAIFSVIPPNATRQVAQERLDITLKGDKQIITYK